MEGLKEATDADMLEKMLIWIGSSQAQIDDMFTFTDMSSLVGAWVEGVAQRNAWDQVCVYGWGGAVDECVEREREQEEEEGRRSRAASGAGGEAADFLSSSPRSPASATFTNSAPSFGASGFSPSSPSNFLQNRNTFKGGPSSEVASMELLGRVGDSGRNQLFLNGNSYAPQSYKDDEAWARDEDGAGGVPPRLRVMPTSYTDLYASLSSLCPGQEQTAICLCCGAVINAGGKGCVRERHRRRI